PRLHRPRPDRAAALDGRVPLADLADGAPARRHAELLFRAARRGDVQRGRRDHRRVGGRLGGAGPVPAALEERAANRPGLCSDADHDAVEHRAVCAGVADRARRAALVLLRPAHRAVGGDRNFLADGWIRALWALYGGWA